MSEIDYEKVQLKSGLEIHQQLDTGKLFSRTPSHLRSDEPHYEVKRKLHAVAGEEGEVDAAVKHEASLDKEFVYQGYHDTTSLVEIDEAPPQAIDSEALDVALQIALLMKCEIYPASQVMRKTVIDGSNPGGFQRTVLIGHDGYIETSFGKVGIESLALEEDSVIYKLDRLGVPLVEITTSPDMRKPEQIKEAALKIGEILRSCKVKRGIGTIRQDVNVSTKGHPRVEIKGFQDPKMMVKTVDLEIERQQGEKGGKGAVRKALEDGTTKFMRPIPGRARMYPETDLPLLKIGRVQINELKKNLPKLKGVIKDELSKRGVKSEMISLVRDRLDEFNALMKVSKDADLVSKMIVIWRKEIANKLKKPLDEVEKTLGENVLEKILEELQSKKIEIGDIKNVMADIASGKILEDAIKIEKAGNDEIEEFVRKLVSEKKGMRPNAYMGLIMKEFKGMIDAKKAMELIEKVLG
jgi:Glu-tRNA(Gln) amidotransferase subunit E-like FAD-binding protein